MADFIEYLSWYLVLQIIEQAFPKLCYLVWHGTNLKKYFPCTHVAATRELRYDQHSMQEDYLLIGIHSLPPPLQQPPREKICGKQIFSLQFWMPTFFKQWSKVFNCRFSCQKFLVGDIMVKDLIDVHLNRWTFEPLKKCDANANTLMLCLCDHDWFPRQGEQLGALGIPSLWRKGSRPTSPNISGGPFICFCL